MRTLLAVAVVFVLAGCAGESAPLPDIEATVEARIELVKETLVVPTAVPLPTYTPMPVPSPEVVVKEVPVEIDKIVEVEVIKEIEVPGPERVITKEVIVEKPVEVVIEKIVEVPGPVVEKIVEVVVVASPTPLPTPTPTATPTPNPLDYISTETSTGTTKAGLPYIDVLVRNTHPSLSIEVRGELHFVEKDSDGYIVSKSKKPVYGPVVDDLPCLNPNQTYRFRYEDKDPKNVTTNLEWSRGWIGPNLCDYIDDGSGGNSIGNIDETLLDYINIQRTSAYAFSVEIKNDSKDKISWIGKFLITDEHGYEIRRYHVFLAAVPNGRVTWDAIWHGEDNFVACAASGLCGGWDTYHGPFYVNVLNLSESNPGAITDYGDFTTDLKLNEATLTTTSLRKIE